MTYIAPIESPKLVPLTTLDSAVEIQNGQTKYHEIELEENLRVIYTITDGDATSQDYALSCWFSDRPYNFNIPFDGSSPRKSVQKNSPLRISIQHEIHERNEEDVQLDAYTIILPTGTYFFNVENRSGGEKTMTISQELRGGGQ